MLTTKKKKSQNNSHILSIINQKGGVGKSTTAVNLAAALGVLDKKVLLIDLDPQGNSTSGFGIAKETLEGDVYNALLEDVALETLILPTEETKVSIVPATIQLAGAEIELVSKIARESVLKHAISELPEEYDFILIDCPPSLGLLTLNALVASDGMLIPIQTEYYALEGVTKLLETMRMVQNTLNPNLEIYGVVMTMFDRRTTLSNQVVNEVKAYFEDKTFNTLIPRSVKVSEAPSHGIPVTRYSPKNKGAVAYQKLAKEVVNRA